MNNERKNITIEYVKSLGKERSEESFDILLELYREDLPVEVKREVVSSIGRQNNIDRVYNFIKENAFDPDIIMEYVYQMFRTCLYKSKDDPRFVELGEEIKNFYNNEVIEKMDYYHKSKGVKWKRNSHLIPDPLLLAGDSAETLKTLPENSVNLIFTSPPYYNAKIYSDYHSYEGYLQSMLKVLKSCHRVLEDGRFIIVNVSPVITKRPGREFESIRHPIHFDFHRILVEAGFYFVDEIIWIKPEPSVPNRIGGYMQTRKPLGYKPNCITESLLVYRKNSPFLLDRNMNLYREYDRFEDEPIDTTNCWYIPPKSDKNHPAVFPEELCRRILKYYSFEGDVVLDPFAGSGTLGRVAHKLGRTPIMCEVNEEYIENMMEDEIYVLRRGCNSRYDSESN